MILDLNNHRYKLLCYLNNRPVSLNFYTKHLISRKDLSASRDIPLCIVGVIVHRLFLIAVINKFELLTKKKRDVCN